MGRECSSLVHAFSHHQKLRAESSGSASGWVRQGVLVRTRSAVTHINARLRLLQQVVVAQQNRGSCVLVGQGRL